MRISTISARGAFSARSFCSISAISGSPATSGPCRRARRCSRASRFITVRVPRDRGAARLETYLLLAVNHQSLIATKASRINQPRAGPRGDGIRLPPGAGSGRGDPSLRARRISRAAWQSPARSPDQLYGVPASARWRTPGCRCSIPSMTPSALTARATRRTRCCSWTPTTRSNPAFPTPSAPSTTCSSPWASPNAASGSTPAICPISRREVPYARRGGLGELHHHLLQLARRIYHPGPAAAGRVHRLLRRRRAAHHRQERAGVRRWRAPVAVERIGRGRPEDRMRAKTSPRSRSPTSRSFSRFYDRTNGKALCGLFCQATRRRTIRSRSRSSTRKKTHGSAKTLTNFRAENMMVPPRVPRGELSMISRRSRISGKCCVPSSSKRSAREVRRFENPHGYYVDLSNRLWDIRHDLS